jgi:hypothetical protein
VFALALGSFQFGEGVRTRRPKLHRAWMIRNFALTTAAVTLRIYLPVSMLAGIPFGIAYPVVAWLCWLPNLFAALHLTARPYGAWKMTGVSMAINARKTSDTTTASVVIGQIQPRL